MKVLYRFGLVLIMLGVLTACGWQLRGSPLLFDLGSVEVRGGSFDIHDLLVQALESSKVDVHPKGDFILRLSEERFDRRTVAVDAQGRAAETELDYRIRWVLLESNGTPLTETGSVNLTRTVHVDPTNATASSDEESAIKNSMYQDAAWQILRQLNAASAYLFTSESENHED